MINTNLLEIIRTFSADEMKKFEEMIRSPYFNKNNPLIKLFEQIKKQYPKLKSVNLKKEDIYLKMFPDKKYNYGSMKNIIYDLQKLCEKFIVIQEMTLDEFDVNRYLINGLRNKKLTNLYEKKLKELDISLKGKEFIDDKYFLKMYLQNEIKQNVIFDNSKSNIHIKENIRTPYFEQHIVSSAYIKKYYLLDTLRTFNFIITNKNILDLKSVIKNCDEFINENKDNFNEQTLDIEYRFLKLNLGRITDKEFLYLKLLTIKELYEMKANENVIYAYSVYLLNYCRVKNHTDNQYITHAFDIVKSIVANDNCDTDHGYMNLILARNIILISTQLNEFHWCDNFLKLQMKRIHPDYRDSIMNFYNANKYFYEGKFGKSLEHLAGMNNDDIFNKNYIKELTILNYYELKYFDLLNEQIDSYKKFIINNEMFPDSYKVRTKKFVDYLYKLFKAASEKKKDLHLLRKDINNEEGLLYKTWLIEKLNELESLNK